MKGVAELALTAFYENRLPPDSRQDDAEEGTVPFKFKPKGADEGEDVSIHSSRVSSTSPRS
jgi:hypothetical protein